MFESSGGGDNRAKKRLVAGEIVEAKVIEISGGSVFLDVGAGADGQMELSEFDDRPVKIGDRIRVTVVNPRSDGPQLSLSLGRGGGALDSNLLKLAHESGTPVSGVVTQAVKGGLSVEVGGVRAFCPASQVERGFVENVDAYVGQTFDFKVLEIKEGGRNVIVSRRALLEDQRRQAELSLLGSIEVGTLVEGTVKSIVRSGAVIDLGGAEGFVHVSELSRQRVDKVEDVLSVGEKVTTQVLALEQGERGVSIRLSLKALSAAPESQGSPAADKEEVLEGEVSRHVPNGVIVKTAKGEGLVPLRELDLPPGADHRRAYPVGRKLEVVLVARDPQSGKLRFSVGQVANVVERKNYKEFSSHGAKGASLGSLGDLLAKKLGGAADKKSATKRK